MIASHRFKIGFCGSKEYTGVGYIGNIFMILNCLMDKQTTSLYVENSKTYYNPDEKTHFFEWFFDQHFSIGPTSKHVSNLHYLDYYKNTYTPNDPACIDLKNKFWNSFSFKTDFAKLLDDKKKELSFEKKTLGVQIRTGDMPNGLKCDLPEYLLKIKKAMDVDHFDQLFVACDSDETLDFLQPHFPNFKYLKDIYRTTSTDPFKRMTPTERDNHMFKLAQEAMLDTFLLSNCDSFIKAKTSALSLVAAILADQKVKVHS